jgi:DNA-binding response OmpR family regulator
VERPAASRDAVLDAEYLFGKSAVVRVALALPLQRAARACAAALVRGERMYVGSQATGREPVLVTINPPPKTSTATGRAEGAEPDAAAEPEVAGLFDATKELGLDELARFDDPTAAIALDDHRPAVADALAHGTRRLDKRSKRKTIATSTDAEHSSTAQGGTGSAADEFTPVAGGPENITEGETPYAVTIDTDEGEAYAPEHGRGPRIVVVDDDVAVAQLVAKELASLGYAVEAVGTAAAAIDALHRTPPDVVIADVMLPDMGGFQLCRAIKESKKYGGIGVLLMSAVIDSGNVGPEVLSLYGADDYFEKPLNLKRLKRKLRKLLVARGAAPMVADQSFDRALVLFRSGELDGAVAELRRGLAADPLSPKHHFVLANLLQKQQLVHEAIDEYEAVLELKPDYFPALTRLAYLYYKRGLPTKAIDTWRRALPVCPDPTLRANIEGFMRKLLAELARG